MLVPQHEEVFHLSQCQDVVTHFESTQDAFRRS